jgi:hypothetical protein
MNVEREQIRRCVAQLFDGGAVTDELIDYVERRAPVLRYFFTRKASGRLRPGRAVAFDFLRSMPEGIFRYLLTCALDFLRRLDPDLEGPEARDVDLFLLATLLFFEGRQIETYCGTDEELLGLVTCFANLVLLEEQERAGVGEWVEYHESLELARGDLPLQLN